MIRKIGAVLLALLGASSCTTTPPTTRANAHVLADAEKALLNEQYAQAAGLFEAYLVDNPSEPQKAHVRLQAGKAHLGAGRAEPAIRAFDQALSESPPPPVRWEIQFRRAVAIRLSGDPVRAVEQFRLVASAPMAERGRSVPSDELHWEHATALFRAGDFRAGQAELGAVGRTGAYEKKLASRVGLTAYTVQVGAYGDAALAGSEAARVKGSVRAIPGDRTLWLVTAGSFARYDDALLEADRLKRLGYTDAFVLP